MAELESDPNIKLSTALEEDGNYSMKGVPSGTYVFWAEVGGKKSRELDGVVVKNKQIINNLQIEVFEGGWLKLKASGCLEEVLLHLFNEDIRSALFELVEYDDALHCRASIFEEVEESLKKERVVLS